LPARGGRPGARSPAGSLARDGELLSPLEELGLGGDALVALPSRQEPALVVERRDLDLLDREARLGVVAVEPHVELLDRAGDVALLPGEDRDRELDLVAQDPVVVGREADERPLSLEDP